MSTIQLTLALKQMLGNIFLPLSQCKQKSSSIQKPNLKKRASFHVSIRRESKASKMREVREINFIADNKGIDIEQMARALPNSRHDLCIFLSQYPEYGQAVSSLILKHIFEATDSRAETQTTRWDRFAAELSSQEGVFQQMYLLNLMLFYQSTSVAEMLQMAFDQLLQKCVAFSQISLIWESLTLIWKNTKLNFVPVQQIQKLLSEMNHSQKNQPCNQEIEAFYYLTRNYFGAIEKSSKTANRLKNIFETIDKLFENLEGKMLLKLCLSVTSHEHIDTLTESTQNLPFQLSRLLTTQQMWKTLIRNVFFGADESINELSLQIIYNLLIDFDSQALWRSQKLDLTELFNEKIMAKKENDSSKDSNLFLLYSQVFLLSIAKIPIRKIFLQVVLYNEYILQIMEMILEQTDFQMPIQNLVEDIWIVLLSNFEEKSWSSLPEMLAKKLWRDFFLDHENLLNLMEQKWKKCYITVTNQETEQIQI